jgi:DNA-directed RNA polymerase subunit RPC12/RpoP
MDTKYKCKNAKCEFYDVPMPFIRTRQNSGGKGRICPKCESRMIVAEKINVSGGPRSGGKGRAGYRSR